MAEAGPKDETVVYSLDEVLDGLGGFEAIEALQGHVLLNEGPRHQGRGTIIRVAARKPG